MHRQSQDRTPPEDRHRSHARTGRADDHWPDALFAGGIWAEDISLGMLSDEFHLSAQYISQLFKSEIGVMFILMSLLCRHGASCPERSARNFRKRHIDRQPPVGRLLFIFWVPLEK